MIHNMAEIQNKILITIPQTAPKVGWFTPKSVISAQESKAKMIPAELVAPMTGHDIGGVCPFGINHGVTVYLDESLKKHEIVYPAVGSDHSGVKMSIPELEKCTGCPEWVDVCRQPGE